MQNPNALKRFKLRRKNKQRNLLKYAQYLADWARIYIQKTNCVGYVVGISGGIDSALCVAILSNTPNIKTLGVFIDIESSEVDRKHAELLKDKYDFKYEYINLTEEYKGLVKKLHIEQNKLAQQNLKSRLRSNALYALAAANQMLVCGTSNADERLVGYYTKFGDSACDVQLIAWLLKAQIRFLAADLKVPVEIINKAPSAGLYEGQTDEKDMGITYNEIDHYLCYGFIDQIQDTKITTRFITNQHKMQTPAKPKKFMPLRNLKK